MKSQSLVSVPEPTLRRLPYYLRILKELRGQDVAATSCTVLSEKLNNLDPTQIRKDIAHTGIVGKPKTGYEVPALIEAIETFLGWNNTHNAFLVGAGNLGKALLGYKGFASHGMEIVAVFDSDNAKIDRTYHGKQVLPLKKLPNLAQRMHALIGIVTVPAEAAQPVADLMICSGIRAIWNFTPVRLAAPSRVIVEHVELSTSLAILSQKLGEALRQER